jgi:hypothetical protein
MVDGFIFATVVSQHRDRSRSLFTQQLQRHPAVFCCFRALFFAVISSNTVRKTEEICR